jgi:hypothetical protein
VSEYLELSAVVRIDYASDFILLSPTIVIPFFIFYAVLLLLFVSLFAAVDVPLVDLLIDGYCEDYGYANLSDDDNYLV